jgi:hypothetical protein
MTQNVNKIIIWTILGKYLIRMFLFCDLDSAKWLNLNMISLE